MQPQQCYDAWAPAHARWSPWAKPVLFVTSPARIAVTAPPPQLPHSPSPVRLPAADGRGALVIDLPGAQSVAWAVSAARAGYQPVPLYNTTIPPRAGVLDLRALVDALYTGAAQLASIHNPAEAPPAFILDAERLGIPNVTRAPTPGDYDNRWIVFPQDFPSARLLRAHGIESVTVIIPEARAPRHDLLHTLRALHAGGLAVRFLPLNGAAFEHPLRASFFQRIAEWFKLRASGLHRNSAGGFGGTVPMPSQGGSG
ncbi:MAG TPA: hypothetical protein VFF65_01595, partial [Phycisphaerales bacterium]|nr:hypothetical protein [Phycisphaerales bacterium]